MGTDGRGRRARLRRSCISDATRSTPGWLLAVRARPSCPRAEGLYGPARGRARTWRRNRGEGAIRTGPAAHAVLRLADGSTVDVNERTEMFVTAAWSGDAIHLQRGDVIVQAAKQRRGHLRVLTRDSIASVKGTVFAVSAGMRGSVVSVVEGSVEVNQPGRDVMLRPGQQAASNPALATSVAAGNLLESRSRRIPGAPRLVRKDRASGGGDSQARCAPVPLCSRICRREPLYTAPPRISVARSARRFGAAEQQAFENAAFRHLVEL